MFVLGQRSRRGVGDVLGTSCNTGTPAVQAACQAASATYNQMIASGVDPSIAAQHVVQSHSSIVTFDASTGIQTSYDPTTGITMTESIASPVSATSTFVPTPPLQAPNFPLTPVQSTTPVPVSAPATTDLYRRRKNPFASVPSVASQLPAASSIPSGVSTGVVTGGVSTPAQTSTSDLSSYLPYLLIGGVALLVLMGGKS